MKIVPEYTDTRIVISPEDCNRIVAVIRDKDWGYMTFLAKKHNTTRAYISVIISGRSARRGNLASRVLEDLVTKANSYLV